MTVNRQIVQNILVEAESYEIAMDDSPDRLNRVIRKKLQDGWKLYGYPFPVRVDDHTDFIAQAVIKLKNE